MHTLTFTVLGRPQPAGSKRPYLHPSTKRPVVVDAAKGSRPWKQEVAGAALAALHGDPLPFPDGPIELTVTFYRQRPKGDYGTGKNATFVKASASAYPVSRPDTTKLLRAVEDALTSVIWSDDAQVVDQHVFKRYGTPERALITVRRLPAAVADHQSQPRTETRAA
jgi:Holliday junction resolvase RusA-like endonuclease